MASLANSDGWIEKPKAWIHSLAPLTVVPSTMVATSNAKPMAPIM